MQVNTTTMENSMEAPQKTKTRQSIPRDVPEVM
jgi:hypothetical protein